MKHYIARVETRPIGSIGAFTFQAFTFSLDADKATQTEQLDALRKALEVARLEPRFCVSIQATDSSETAAKPL